MQRYRSVFLGALLVLASCAAGQAVAPYPTEEVASYFGGKVIRFVDTDWQNVCYLIPGTGISCVKYE